MLRLFALYTIIKLILCLMQTDNELEFPMMMLVQSAILNCHQGKKESYKPFYCHNRMLLIDVIAVLLHFHCTILRIK